MTARQAPTSQLAETPPLVGALLKQLTQQDPAKILYTHLMFDGSATLQLTYGEIWQRACGIAELLTALQLRQRPVLLLYAPGADFAPAFFGALLAGAVAVPVPVPQFAAQYERLGSIALDCEPGAILMTAAMAERLDARLAAESPLRRCQWLSTDGGPDVSAFIPEPVDAEEFALLQYTSGSTSEPKGVALTHANLAHNLAMQAQEFRPPVAGRIVSWLPHFHDMGLITGITGPLTCGGEAILLAPLAFLHRPLRWLQAISDYRGQISGAPNFAYELCVKWAQRGEHSALDLSCWQNAFIGAEPIRYATLDRFANCFSADGFRRAALLPCYGMAEATLLVTCKPSGTLPNFHALAREAIETGLAVPSHEPDALLLTGCGYPAAGTRLRIVDPHTCIALDAGHIGEAWIAGPQIARGYWNKDSEAVFGARLADGSDDIWLRTGDLGFVADTGEFVFVDRLKDLIIVNGQNYACHDLELTAGASHALLSAHGCIAVSIDSGAKAELIIAAEFPLQALERAGEAAAEIRAALFSTHALAVNTIVFVPPRKLCRTTSGKLQRRLTARALIDAKLRILACYGDPLPLPSSTLPGDPTSQ